MTGYQADAYERLQFPMYNAIVYVERKNGTHFQCVYTQILEPTGKLEKYTYDAVAGVYREN